jgi:DNA-binding CsgD family transcriptional regulator
LRQITPAKLKGFSLLMAGPVDWAELPETPDAEDLRQTSSTCGSQHVLTFPLRPLTAEKAILCLAAAVEDGEWHQLKARLLSDFQALGNYFHQHILRIYGHDTEGAMLVSAREIDCLRWIAAGKTAWEASKILGISERTVRFHLNTAREKLHCITTTQAVAKAISQQLI